MQLDSQLLIRLYRKIDTDFSALLPFRVYFCNLFILQISEFNIPTLYTCTYICLATMSLLSAGIALGWNSPSIPKLLAPDSPIRMTREEGSWLIIVAVIGLLITSYPASWIADRCVHM